MCQDASQKWNGMSIVYKENFILFLPFFTLWSVVEFKTGLTELYLKA